MDFFSNPEARRMWQNRLRYVIARWGYATHLLAWEFWNEINCVFGYAKRSQEMIDWSAAMGDYLHQHDPWNHLVVNSLGSFELDDRLWKLPQLDFAQVHGYWHPTLAASKDTGKDMGEMVPLWLTKIRDFGKPALFAECGLVNDRWGPSPLSAEDRDGVALHDMLWAGLAAGGCGTAMMWWHDNQVDKYDLYGQFTPVAKFAADVPWDTAGFRPVTAEASDPRVRALALLGRDR
ncbi:MAG: hypothetical protein HYU66_01045, partial [Armatimonadetes bacterium]|nr:hypothetical protein [Armatimonadota bacterium]